MPGTRAETQTARMGWRHRTRRAAASLWVGLGLACAGCSSASIDSPGLTLPKVPDISAVAAIGKTDEPVGTATEIYSRVALGANSCWFGAAGPLKADYIYHAEADAPSRGGKAEIVIHKRDPSQPNPRGYKVFKVKIDPVSETAAKLQIENLKMPETLAQAMSSDVNRWARGDQGCAGTSTVAGWGTAAPPPAVEEKPASKTAKKSRKTKPKDTSASASR